MPKTHMGLLFGLISSPPNRNRPERVRVVPPVEGMRDGVTLDRLAEGV